MYILQSRYPQQFRGLYTSYTPVTLWRSHLPWKNAKQFMQLKPFTQFYYFFVPPGTQYCWVTRGDVDLKLAQGFYIWPVPQGIEPQALNFRPHICTGKAVLSSVNEMKTNSRWRPTDPHRFYPAYTVDSSYGGVEFQANMFWFQLNYLNTCVTWSLHGIWWSSRIFNRCDQLNDKDQSFNCFCSFIFHHE